MYLVDIKIRELHSITTTFLIEEIKGIFAWKLISEECLKEGFPE